MIGKNGAFGSEHRRFLLLVSSSPGKKHVRECVCVCVYVCVTLCVYLCARMHTHIHEFLFSFSLLGSLCKVCPRFYPLSLCVLFKES